MLLFFLLLSPSLSVGRRVVIPPGGHNGSSPSIQREARLSVLVSCCVEVQSLAPGQDLVILKHRRRRRRPPPSSRRRSFVVDVVGRIQGSFIIFHHQHHHRPTQNIFPSTTTATATTTLLAYDVTADDDVLDDYIYDHNSYCHSRHNSDVGQLRRRSYEVNAW